MRKIKLYILVLAGAWILGACSEDFLDLKPLTGLTEAEFFTNIQEMEMNLVSCYNRLYLQSDMMCYTPTVWDDNAHAGMGLDGTDWNVMQHFDLTIAPRFVNVYGRFWGPPYTTIFRVNLLLQKLDDIDWSNNPERRIEMEAELRFMRAQSYFNLVRYWERVPLLTEPSSENLPQSEPDETYAVIADDLLFAAEHAPGTISSRAKITKWAVKHLIARVYLFYTGYYQKPDVLGKITKAQALQGLEDIIGSGNFELVPEYKNLFVVPSAVLNEAGDNWDLSYAGKDNREVVFAHRHNITDWNAFQGILMAGNRDERYPPYGFGWGGLTVKKEFYDSFEENDPRREASIVALVEEGFGDMIKKDYQLDYTGYKTKKYIPLSLPNRIDYVTSLGGIWQRNQFWDFVNMRYADVLLLAAELGSPNAQQYFDMVRDRVNLPSKPVTFENIMNERNFEFAFEGLRYWDLMRQGLDVLAETLAWDGIVLNGGAEYRKVINPDLIIEKRGFQQIPQNQIDRSNGVLVQNPGW